MGKLLLFLNVWWVYATLFVYLLFCYNTYIHTIIHSLHLLMSISISSQMMAQRAEPPRGPEPRFKLGTLFVYFFFLLQYIHTFIESFTHYIC